MKRARDSDSVRNPFLDLEATVGDNDEEDEEDDNDGASAGVPDVCIQAYSTAALIRWFYRRRARYQHSFKYAFEANGQDLGSRRRLARFGCLPCGALCIRT